MARVEITQRISKIKRYDTQNKARWSIFRVVTGASEGLFRAHTIIKVSKLQIGLLCLNASPFYLALINQEQYFGEDYGFILLEDFLLNTEERAAMCRRGLPDGLRNKSMQNPSFNAKLARSSHLGSQLS